MLSIGIFEVNLWIKGKKFTHPVNVFKELNNNIVGINLIHWNQLTYNVIARQVKFAGSNVNSITAIKQTVLPAMTSTVIKVKYKGLRDPTVTYMVNICVPPTPMVSSMPSLVSIDDHNICNIVVENCTSYDVTLDRDDILGIIDTEN
jgi:hypothetical protein